MTRLVEPQDDNDVVEKVLPKPKLSIDRLEAALKRRIGWVDEVISPFARRKSERSAEAKSLGR
jgi:hypothetical protein